MRAPALLAVFAYVAALPSVASDRAPVAQSRIPHSGKNALPPSQTTLFNQLLEEAKGIDPELHAVTDKTSADKAAIALQARMARMDKLLKELEKAPSTPGAAHAVATQMTALTHVTQGVMPTIQRLIEVNAYGSDSLLNILRRYRVSQDASETPDDENSPQVRLYEELIDNMSDALYVLRKTQDPSTAKTAALALREALAEHRRLQYLLSALGPAFHIDDQQEAIKPSRERLSCLREELKQESDRLREFRYYFDPDLPRLLQEYIDTSN